MTQHESALDNEHSEDRFYAQFDSREVELMTLDELAAAFEAGRIHGNTFVCREGESEWATLAEVAGLGEEEEQDEPLAAPVVETRPAMPSRRPEAVELAAATETRPPMPSRRPDAVAGETRPPMPERRPEMNTVPAQRFQAAQSVAPIAPVQSSPALSYAPVTSSINDSALDIDDLSLRPKRRWGLVMAAAAALALAGGGAAFALSSGSAMASAIPDKAASDSASTHSAAALTANVEANKPAEAAPSTPEPAAAAPAPASDTPSTDSSAKPAGFSDDMKAALLAQDKSRADKHAKKVKGQKAVAASAAPHHGKAAGGSGGLKTGGSAYDPLNGKL